MANERLRDSLMRTGLTPTTLAGELGVDPKTVQRWVTTDRAPYPKHRYQVAARVGESEAWLWPRAISAERRDQASRSEVVEVHARRASIPADEWGRLIDSATTFIDLLAYAALFLPEQAPGVVEQLRAKAAEGVRVRILLGDPDSTAVALRGDEEGIGRDAVATKVRNSLALLRRPLLKARGVSVRLHDTTLYTSIYRADDEIIANPHVYGLPAAQSPALHLRRLSAGGLFDTYAAMYDRVWDEARPAWG